MSFFIYVFYIIGVNSFCCGLLYDFCKILDYFLKKSGFFILNGIDFRENCYECGLENSISVVIIKNLIIFSWFVFVYILCEIWFILF